MSNLNRPSNELYQIEPDWPDRCDKPNWVFWYAVIVSFLIGTIFGIGLAYLMTN